MKIVAGMLFATLLVGGCAAQTTAPQTSARTFTGEVWTWDEKENTITLRQAGQIVRVKVSPNQFIGLQLHQVATIRGELAPPMDIVTVVTPAAPMVAVPRGAPEQLEVSGTVQAVDAQGRMTVRADRGPLNVWVAPGADTRFRPGSNVQLRMTLQSVDMVASTTAPAATVTGPAASVPSEPADYSTVTGRIMKVDPAGVLIVESPQGPIEIWVPSASRYQVGQFVQLRTVVSVK